MKENNLSSEKALGLYVETSQLMQYVKSERKTYSKAYELYKKAQARINRIQSKYPSSKIAIGIKSRQAKISGFTLYEFEEIGRKLKILADAEKDPFSCGLALFSADLPAGRVSNAVVLFTNYQEVGEKEKVSMILSKALNAQMEWTISPYVLAKIAIGYTYLGQKQKSSQVLLLAQSLLIVQKNLNNYNYSHVLDSAMIATGYAKEGHKEKAIQVLTQAKIKEFIESFHMGLVGSGPSVLSAIATAYVEAGQLPQALKVANKMIVEEKTKTLVKIALSYAKRGQKKEVTQLLTQALEQTNKYNGLKRLELMAIIAVAYTKIDQKEKATQLLFEVSQALKMMTEDKQNSFDVFWKLSQIAVAYAIVGQKEKATQLLNQALRVIKNIRHFEDSLALIFIAAAYKEAGLQPDEKAQLVLRKILHSKKPIISFWE